MDPSTVMIYQRQLPAQQLRHIIDCYWYIDSLGEMATTTQKIVPDGYPEVILHYGDPYQINLTGNWKTQDQYLLAGQIKRHFYLRNTGKSGMLGVKFKPSALTYIFDLNQSEVTDKVVPLPSPIIDKLMPVLSKLNHDIAPETLFGHLDQTFFHVIPGYQPNRNLDAAMALLFHKKGNLSVAELTSTSGYSERQLERLFRRYIGLSPKFYTRIIRLAHIFELMKKGDKSWSDLVYASGFYDQSHFIKNFKEFTGEDPSVYGFDEQNMANFHLKG